jgi:uncharacterized protein involved in exopolysaccharide biosynthesis
VVVVATRWSEEERVVGKILETVFRHKLLILLPPILIPLIVGPVTLLTWPVYYETFVGIWVEQPSYLRVEESANRFRPPSEARADRLLELLRSRTFLADVVKRTSLAPLLESEGGEERIRTMIGRDFATFTSGDHLLNMRFRAATPELSFQVLNAIVETFKDRVAADRSTQASVAISFYQSRVDAAQTELDKANTALRRYTAASARRGGLTSPIVGSRSDLPTAAADPQLAELLNRTELAQSEFERARATLDQAQLQATASIEGQDLGFQIVDPPRMPTAPTSERRRMVIYPIAGLVTGLAISVLLIVVLAAGDHSIRFASDLEAVSRVVVAVPHVTLDGVPQTAGRDITRRAVGLAAGAALRAP